MSQNVFNAAVTDKVIFLDFDGPQSSFRTYLYANGNLAFDPVSTKILSNICEAANARIVCTSTRTFTRGKFYNPIYHETKAHFERAGFDWSFMHPDWTVNKPEFTNRKGNIEAYLKLHPEIKQWAIVDDEFVDMPELVRVDHMDGILYNQIEQICNLLDINFRDIQNVNYYKEKDARQFQLPFNQYNVDWNKEHVRKENKPCQPS